MEKNETLESKVANVLLQKETEIQIGKKTYKAAPPTLATLIAVSELISKLPHYHLDGENVVTESLHIAKDCKVIGDIIAVLILGAKPPTPRTFLLRWLRREKQDQQRLATEILHELSPTQLHSTMAALLNSLNIADFFALTTFLLDINLTKKKVDATETTAPGH